MDAPAWNGEPGSRWSDPERRRRPAQPYKHEWPTRCRICGKALGMGSKTIAGVGGFCAEHRDYGEQSVMDAACMLGEGQGRR